VHGALSGDKIFLPQKTGLTKEVEMPILAEVNAGVVPHSFGAECPMYAIVLRDTGWLQKWISMTTAIRTA
jgi:hypothetical protein